jgi:hypothetical protein
VTLLLWVLLLILESTASVATSSTATLTTSAASVVEFVSVAHVLLLIGSRLLHMLLLLHFVPIIIE